MRKFIIFLSLILILVSGIVWYQYQHRTVECWWGVMYPSLSFIGFEEDTKVSALDTNYMPTSSNETKYKLAIVEWLENLFSF